MIPESKQELLTSEQAAQFADVSAETLDQYLELGFLKATESDGTKLFERDDLAAFFGLDEAENQTTEASSEPQPQPETSQEAVTVEKLPITSSPESIELTKSLREQVKVLKEERNWLRERVEKLEARLDREQMLLMSDHEIIRSLVPQNQNKRKFWSFALPWSKSND